MITFYQFLENQNQSDIDEARQIDSKEWLFAEGQMANIKNLQPDTVITVFHGTDTQAAYDFCINGIDARSPYKGRKYPHLSGGKELKFGIFIAPNLKTAQKFGYVVIKFKTIGKNLIYRYPVEMKETDKYWKKYFPNSFRPSVSYDMSDLSGVEPQALYIGLLSPRAIEKVFYQNRENKWIPMSREEFITFHDENITYTGKVNFHQSIFEPQEYNMTLDEFVNKIAKDQECSPEEILNTLKHIYKKHGYLSGIGKIPPTLLRNIEIQLKKLISNEN